MRVAEPLMRPSQHSYVRVKLLVLLQITANSLSRQKQVGKRFDHTLESLSFNCFYTFHQKWTIRTTSGNFCSVSLG